MANKCGEKFLRTVRGIVRECSEYQSPAKAARLTAFSLLVALDGSGEHCGDQFRIVAEDGELAEFCHHDL
jgi:hypothetical protein